jgi:hypothetical protein
MDDCKIGSKVYIDNIIDIEARVVDKDYSNNMVKVQLDSGKTKWVKISNLMSPLGKKVEDKIEEKVRDVIFDWIFSDKKEKKE